MSQSNVNSSRVSKTLLSRTALFAVPAVNVNCLSPSPQCIHGSLVKATSALCPMHGTQLSLCANEAKVLSKANKILMYVCICILILRFYFIFSFINLFMHLISFFVHF